MKKLIFILSLIIFLSSCTTFKYEIKTKDEEVNIAITSDIHYIDPSLTGERFSEAQELSDGKLSIYVEELTDAFIEEMINTKPDIVIINGDLTYNGEKLSHETLANKLSKLHDHNIQALVIPGNHDILNINAYDYSHDDAIYYTDFIDVDDYKEIYNDYGYKDAYSIDDNSLSYLFIASDSLWLFMLDSNTYEKNTNFAPSSDGHIKEETLIWMDNLLANKPSDTNVIIFMHHPLLDLTTSESYIIDNQDEVLELINKYQISLSITGHIHAQNYKEKELNNIIHTNLGISSLCVYDHQYTKLKYKTNSFNLESINLDMEDYAKRHNIDDEFFIDFDTNAKEYFKYYSTTRLVGNYSGDDIDEKLSNELYKLKGLFNIYIFNGEGYKLRDLLESQDYYEELDNYRGSYAFNFFRDINIFDKDATKLNIEIDSMLK